jgi:hypothetical protein
MAPTMAIRLHPAQGLSSQIPAKNYQLTLSLAYNISTHTTEKHPVSIVVVQLLHY